MDDAIEEEGFEMGVILLSEFKDLAFLFAAFAEIFTQAIVRLDVE